MNLPHAGFQQAAFGTPPSAFGELIHDLTVISCSDGWFGSPLPPGGAIRHHSAGVRLTLYVSNELADMAQKTHREKIRKPLFVFRFAREGRVNDFSYWVNEPFGFATSADPDKSELARVSVEVYRQLDTAR